jgi:hypothetical protein
MRFALNLTFMLLLLAGTSKALDLTPRPTLLKGNEGPPIHALEFLDGKIKYTFIPPQDWLYDGGGRTLRLTASDGSRGWMKLLVVPKQPPAPNPDGTTPPPEDLQAWAAQFIPGGAKTAVFVKETPSPFTVAQHPSDEFTFTYNSYGSKDLIAVAVVDFSEAERLVVIISSGPKYFEKIQQQAIRSMFSFQKER